MKINIQGISDKRQWKEKGYSLPRYDVAQVVNATRENPFWIHFGAGNLFRTFHAVIAQNLLDDGKLDRGDSGCRGF